MAPRILAKDKLQHFVAGAVIAAVLYPLMNHFALLVVLVVGFLKEYVVDVVFPWGTPDFWDAIATVLGGLAVGLAVVLSGHL